MLHVISVLLILLPITPTTQVSSRQCTNLLATANAGILDRVEAKYPGFKGVVNKESSEVPEDKVEIWCLGNYEYWVQQVAVACSGCKKEKAIKKLIASVKEKFRRYFGNSGRCTHFKTPNEDRLSCNIKPMPRTVPDNGDESSGSSDEPDDDDQNISPVTLEVGGDGGQTWSSASRSMISTILIGVVIGLVGLVILAVVQLYTKRGKSKRSRSTSGLKIIKVKRTASGGGGKRRKIKRSASSTSRIKSTISELLSSRASKK